MKKYILLLKILITIGLIYYLFRRIDISRLSKQYSNLNLVILSIPLMILFCQCALKALKWKIILAEDNISVHYLYLARSYLIGNFMSLFLPTSIGGDFYRVYSLRKHSSKLGKNISSVLFDRFTGLFTLFTIAILSYICVFKEVIEYKLLAFYFFIVLFFWFSTSTRLITFLDSINSRLISFINLILKSFNRYKNKKTALLKVFLISFIFHSNVVWIVKFYCIAVNVDISIVNLYMFVPLIYITELFPITINGWGVREGAFVYFFSQVGKTIEEAVAVALLLITMRYLFSMLFGGSLFFTTIYKSKNKENVAY